MTRQLGTRLSNRRVGSGAGWRANLLREYRRKTDARKGHGER
jgi:hypothetical protein